ncbi:MAG TPA: toxin-activating lysine-acyltransferase [Steroidobacteraceae bacterium]|nr:toxin-activating lysine-acyltransferase [Steroidobacteraceae bacterium]
MNAPLVNSSSGAPRTVAEALGQVVWLLSQSPLHKELKIKDLEWSFMPAIIHEQFRIFSFGPLPGAEQIDEASLPKGAITREGLEKMPLGVAVWAKVSEAAEQKLERGEHLTLDEWKSGDRVWLVELIAPFANKENKLAEGMLLDLIKGPFAKTPFNLHRTDPATGRRDKVHMRSHLAAAAVSGVSGS